MLNKNDGKAGATQNSYEKQRGKLWEKNQRLQAGELRTIILRLMCYMGQEEAEVQNRNDREKHSQDTAPAKHR